MHVPPGSARSHTGPADPADADLLEALADAGDALTDALVRRDHDAICAATVLAQDLVGRLSRPGAGTPGAGTPGAPGHDPAALVLAARIGAAARRNALLLERAWATDAALLRMLVVAARGQADAPLAGPYAQPSPDPAQPAGWLVRSA
jgi:hypothetical protein